MYISYNIYIYIVLKTDVLLYYCRRKKEVSLIIRGEFNNVLLYLFIRVYNIIKLCIFFYRHLISILQCTLYLHCTCSRAFDKNRPTNGKS